MKKTLFLLTLLSSSIYAANITVPINLVDQSKPIGTITLSSQDHGVLITPDLHGLPPGEHGFHVHENPSCGDKAVAAGSHLDPAHSGKHDGPYNHHGHLGDLPVLIVDKDGNATLPTFAPKFTLSELKKHSLIIHEGADNYSDQPAKLGGGGARIACGIIE